METKSFTMSYKYHRGLTTPQSQWY